MEKAVVLMLFYVTIKKIPFLPFNRKAKDLIVHNNIFRLQKSDKQTPQLPCFSMLNKTSRNAFKELHQIFIMQCSKGLLKLYFMSNL